MRTITYKAGDTILREGEDGNTAFLILDGAVEVSIGDGERLRVLGTLGTGDVFGEMCLLDPGPRSATVIALADTQCAAATYDEFIATIQEDPERAIAFMRTLVRRLRHMNEMMANMDLHKRRLSEIMRDWQKSVERTEADLSEDDKRHYYSTMYLGM